MLARRTCLAAIGAVGLTLLNPDGAALHRFLWLSLSRSRPWISEWRPLSLDPQGMTFLALVLGVGVAVVAASRARRMPMAHVLVLLMTAGAGALHVRHGPFFAIAAVAFAPPAVAALFRRGGQAAPSALPTRTARGIRGLYACVPLVAVLALPTGRDLLTLRAYPVGQSPFPTGAVEYMAASGLRGNVLVYFDWAQYALWRLHPSIRVFFDGRFRTVYPEEVERTFFRFTAPEEPLAPSWREAIDAFPTSGLLLPVRLPAARRLAGEPGWRVAYRDPQALLLVRAFDAESAPTVQRDDLPTLPFEPYQFSRPSGR